MYRFLIKYQSSLTLLLFSVFFFTLIFGTNNLNTQCLIGIGIIALINFSSSRFIEFTKANLPLIILFGIILISLSFTSDLIVGLDKVQRVLIIPLSLLIFSSFYLSQKQRQKLYLIFVLIMLSACIYAHGIIIIKFISAGESEFRSFFNLNYSYQALGETLGIHPTYFSYYILSAIIFLFHFLRLPLKLSTKILVLILVLYFSFFIVHLSSRMAIVILYLIFMIQLLHFGISRRKVWRTILLAIVVHLFLFLAIWNIGVTKYRFQHIFGFSYYTGYTVNDGDHKLKLWKAAIKANDNFLFGNGIGDIQRSLQREYKSNELVKPFNYQYNSHNQFIEYYVGIGFIGLLAFLYFYFYYLKEFVRSRNFIGFQFLLISFLLCITENIWSRHHGIVFLVITLLMIRTVPENAISKTSVDG